MDLWHPRSSTKSSYMVEYFAHTPEILPCLASWSLIIVERPSMSNSSSQVRAAHLLIKHRGSRNPVSRRTGNSVTLSDTDAIQELREYERKIRAEGLDSFPRYASERSDCSSYAKGGDLGFFGPGTVLGRNGKECACRLLKEYCSPIDLS